MSFVFSENLLLFTRNVVFRETGFSMRNCFVYFLFRETKLLTRELVLWQNQICIPHLLNLFFPASFLHPSCIPPVLQASSHRSFHLSCYLYPSCPPFFLLPVSLHSRIHPFLYTSSPESHSSQILPFSSSPESLVSCIPAVPNPSFPVSLQSRSLFLFR